MVAKGPFPKETRSAIDGGGVPPDTQRAVPGPKPSSALQPGREDGTVPLVVCALVPFPAVTLPERCGRSMRFVGEVQSPPGLVALIGGRESG